jgi:hypothetical protein
MPRAVYSLRLCCALPCLALPDLPPSTNSSDPIVAAHDLGQARCAFYPTVELSGSPQLRAFKPPMS